MLGLLLINAIIMFIICVLLYSFFFFFGWYIWKASAKESERQQSWCGGVYPVQR